MPQSRRRLRRIVLITLIVLLTLWAVLWGGASLLAPSLVRRAVPAVVRQMEQRGIGLSGVTFARSWVSPWLNGMGFGDFHARFDLHADDESKLQSVLDVKEVDAWVSNPFTMRGSLRAEGMEIRLGAADLPGSMPFDRFTNGTISITDLPLADPRLAAKELREGLRELFIENHAVGDVEFSGDVMLKVEDVKVAAHMYTERKDDLFRLRFRAEDVKEFAEKMDVELADEQVEIVSLYPLRVPSLIELTDRARDRANEHEPDDEWLRDAHRHVTWSFLLTEKFGEEFAQTVTDAHEKHPGNSPNERAMDFHNNAVGRKWFASGVTLDALPDRVRQDPDVIRHPRQVKEFGAERLQR